MKPLILLLTLFMISCTTVEQEISSVPKSLTPKEKQQATTEDFQEGDLIFHTSRSSQSQAIQIATNSKYSHMGMLYKEANQWYVYEAVQPVKMTKLTTWIQRGENHQYVVKRLKNSKNLLTPQTIQNMKTIGQAYAGKDYDLKFEWSDDKIYCSELVWKIYKKALGIEIGTLEQIKDFDLSNTVVQQKIKERYGTTIPLDEYVISPDRMFNSSLLHTVTQ